MDAEMLLVTDAGIIHVGLNIYVRNQRVASISNISTSGILDWLRRLDGEYVTRLVLMNSYGWLTIDTVDDSLNLCICNNHLEICANEVVSREIAPEKVLQFIEHAYNVCT